MRILLVEDDAMIGKAMELGLKDASYAVDWVQDGQSAIHAVMAFDYDMVVLDLGLPKKDGLVVLSELRANCHELPIIITTARDDLSSRLAGLDGGADDYIIKPFDMQELLARLRVVVRRNHGTAQTVLSSGHITLNLATHEAKISTEPTPIELTHREFAVLQTLMQHQGRIYSRSELEEKIYAWGEEVESNAIDFLIHSLRKKLGKDSIRNIRGAGWQIKR